MSDVPPYLQVSANLIVKDDPHLAQTVDLLRPHVAEVIVVDTSQDGRRAEECRELAAVHVRHPWDLDPITGKELIDFSEARNHALFRSNHPWILWADSDDLIEGLEHLPSVIEKAFSFPEPKALRLVSMYKIAFDASGNCVHQIPRERIVHIGSMGSRPVRQDHGWHWERPVHERLVFRSTVRDSSDTLKREPIDLFVPDLTWIHDCPKDRVPTDRNLEILLRYVSPQPEGRGVTAEVDPIAYLDLGHEYQARRKFDRSAEAFLACFDSTTANLETRSAACRGLSEVCFEYEAKKQSSDYPTAYHWARESIKVDHDSLENRIAYAKMSWMRATQLNHGESYRVARDQSLVSTSISKEGQSFFHNPEDEKVIYRILIDSLAHLNQFELAGKFATEACERFSSSRELHFEFESIRAGLAKKTHKTSVSFRFGNTEVDVGGSVR